jgi:hypothetical protein
MSQWDGTWNTAPDFNNVKLKPGDSFKTTYAMGKVTFSEDSATSKSPWDGSSFPVPEAALSFTDTFVDGDGAQHVFTAQLIAKTGPTPRALSCTLLPQGAAASGEPVRGGAELDDGGGSWTAHDSQPHMARRDGSDGHDGN